MNGLRWFRDTLGGLWELARLGFITRFHFRGPYWSWRMHTAFGKGEPPAGDRRRSILDYARWIHRLRRDHGC